MLGNVAGKHRSPHRGSSVEFAEYRKYVAGDDTRRLDWKAYARSDRYYIKEFEADTNLRAYFVVDASASMTFAHTGPPKIEYATPHRRHPGLSVSQPRGCRRPLGLPRIAPPRDPAEPPARPPRTHLRHPRHPRTEG